MMLGMSDRQRRSFDPNSPGAQRLLLSARAALNPPPAPTPLDPIEILITKTCSLCGYPHDTELIQRQPGERVTVWRSVANTMVKHGLAEFADQPA